MYSLIIIPILVGLITQVIKLAFDGIPGNLDWKNLFRDYGGMPSSHTAFATSVAAVILLREGPDSAAFAVALALLVIVVRDAVGFRREIGRDAALTNKVAHLVLGNKYDHLPERIGHTWAEVIAGFIIGAALSLVLYGLFLIY